MSPLKRFLTAFIFYPLLILWFIPKEYYRAIRKAYRVYGEKLSFKEKLEEAKTFFKQELQVALSSRSRKAIDYSYLDQELKAIKARANADEKLLIDKELGVTSDGEATRGQGS
jgi:hypothetical protein